MSEEKPPEAPPGVHVIANFSLEAIEKAIYAREYEAASRLLLEALRKMKQGGGFIGYAVDSRVQAVLFTRMASAIVALLVDPGYGISQEGFDHFAAEHAVMDTLFRASVYETSDHMLPMISANPTEMDRAKLQIPDGAVLVKFLLTYSMRSGFGMNFEETFRKNPQVMFSLWSGMISPLLTVAVVAHERREQLLGLHEIFADVKVPDAVFPTISDAYMYSSYATRRDKHDMKGTVHRLFAKMLNERGGKVPDNTLMLRRRRARGALFNTKGERTECKPTLLICTEWFSHLHAMYRCYAPVISQLKGTFRVVGMSRACDIDEEAKAIFDEWHEVPSDKLVLSELMRVIVSEIKPDMIYYPSLGMAMWWVIMASVRLAPIQIMTLGHPASSRSPAIDYVICETTSIGDPALFTEKIVALPPASFRFVMRPDVGGVPFDIPMEEHPKVVRVAVPAMLCKLNAPFMAAMREIAERPRTAGGFAVEFHFFINMIGANYFQSVREIHDWIPSAIVHPRADYPGYLTELRRCHLHLATFPFGGTNSNIDSFLMGIPVLAMEGDQPHERFDAVMIRQAGLPEFLITRTKEAYVDMACRLIDESDLRMSLHRLLKRADLQALFFGEPPADRKQAFLDAMTTIYAEHEALQLSDARVITIPPRAPA